MPRRPGGGQPPIDSVEAGLRRLVVDPGPTVARLARDDHEGIRALLRTAQVPPDWTVDETAHAVLVVLQELVESIGNPNWKTAARAAFRMPPNEFEGVESDSLTGRWRIAARNGMGATDGSKGIQRLRGYWISVAPKLAASYEQRVLEITKTDAWGNYRAAEPLAPPFSLPLSFDRTEALYEFEGFRGIRSTSQRLVTAHGPVDHYEVVGWYYSDPESPVDIAPLANCQLEGPLVDLPLGGRSGTLKFSRMLSSGDKYFFAYTVTFNSDRKCRPTILYEVRGLSMRSLTVRAQFDAAVIPVLCWYFDMGVQAESFRTPELGDPEVLEIASNGYIDHEFLNCKPGRQYGLRWIWPDESD